MGTSTNLPKSGGSSGALLPDGSVPITGYLTNLRAQQPASITLTGTATIAPYSSSPFITNYVQFTGTGTKFLAEVSAGDVIVSSTGPSQFSAINVAKVVDDTHMIVYSPAGTWTDNFGSIITNHRVQTQIRDNLGNNRFTIFPNGAVAVGEFDAATNLSVGDETGTYIGRLYVNNTNHWSIWSTQYPNTTQSFSLLSDGRLQMIGGGSTGYMASSGFNVDHTISTVPQTYTPTGTTVSLDCRAGNLVIIQTGSATGSITVTLTNRVTGAPLQIAVYQNGGTPRAVTISGVIWSGGTAYSSTLSAGAVDQVALTDYGTFVLGDWKDAYS